MLTNGRDFLLDIILFLGMAGFAIIAPFTKVEESFNVQGIHDLLFYGPVSIGAYDHHEFPGVVPRTFTGPLLLYVLYTPIGWIGNFFGILDALPKVYHLIFVRILLAGCTTFSHAFLRRSVRKTFGKSAAFYTGLFSLTQFHLLFWGSRLLPNIFALIVVQMALSAWIRGQGLVTLKLFVFSAVVFRSELAILGGLIIVSDLLVYKRYTLYQGVKAFALSFSLSLMWTLLVDSYFWNHTLYWPEFQVFLFNTWKNGSISYGVSPWHAYFTQLAPRINPLGSLLCLSSLFIAPSGVYRLLLPGLGFVALYSFLPHKEWRFIVYIVPLMNISGALLVTHPSFPRILKMGVWLASIGLFGSSVFRAMISSYNYPGGEALVELHSLVNITSVHLDAYTAMTGASRFLQSACPPGPPLKQPRECTISYSKNETLLDFSPFSHLLTHDPYMHSSQDWTIVSEISGFSGIRSNVKEYLTQLKGCPLDKFFFCLLPIQTQPLVWILKKKKI